MKKNTLVILFLFLISNKTVLAQTYTKWQIDSLIKAGEKNVYDMDGKTKPLALNIIKFSKKIQYTRGVIDGYEMIIAYYCFLGEFKTAQEYIALAEKEIPNKEENPQFISIIRFKADCLSTIGLYQRAKNKYKKCLSEADKIKDEDSKHKVKANIYNSIAITIGKQDKNNDSIFYYYRKCISEFKQRTDHTGGKVRSLARANLNISTSLILLKEYDSASYYLLKTLQLLHKNDTSILKLKAYKNLGDVHLGKRRYDSAIYYYESILQKTKAANQSYILNNVYFKLSNIYAFLNNDKKSKEYQDKFILINKKINRLEGEALESSIKNIEKNHVDNFRTTRKNFNLIISCMLLSLGIVLYYFFKKIKNVKKINKLLYKKEEELELLNHSNRVTLQEVLQLAINKDSSFNTKFQELEPDFYEKLNKKAITPLNYNDLIFCAMIRLGFITKEIAQNLNSTVGAVETRKYRLRKKINIASSDEDLTIWMMNL